MLRIPPLFSSKAENKIGDKPIPYKSLIQVMELFVTDGQAFFELAQIAKGTLTQPTSGSIVKILADYEPLKITPKTQDIVSIAQIKDPLQLDPSAYTYFIDEETKKAICLVYDDIMKES